MRSKMRCHRPCLLVVPDSYASSELFSIITELRHFAKEKNLLEIAQKYDIPNTFQAHSIVLNQPVYIDGLLLHILYSTIRENQVI